MQNLKSGGNKWQSLKAINAFFELTHIAKLKKERKKNKEFAQKKTKYATSCNRHR